MSTADSTSTSTSTTTVVPLIINGEDIHTGTTFPVTSPATHTAVWTATAASTADARAAADAAAAAFPAWSRTRVAARRDLLLRAAELLRAGAAEYVGYMRAETAADAAFAGLNIDLSVEILKDLAGRVAGGLVGAIPPTAKEGTGALVLKEPYGVVLGIAPWNSPYILGFRAVAFALAAGNTCILKGSELAPRTFWAIGDIFRQAGLPAGVLNVLVHRPADAAAVTTALIEHDAVRKINFTGSTAVGAIIAATAGRHLKPCLMELGGKASAIVLDDADVELAAQQCALGAFIHSGQVCMSTERILVQSSILPRFRPALQAAIGTLFPAAGPASILVQPAAVARNRALVADALAKGARILHGPEPEGEKETDNDPTSTTHMQPTAFEAVTPHMSLYHTESFGPTVSVLSVGDDEEALRVANDTGYGLTAAVFTRDLGRALRLARRLETGAVHVNSMTIHDEPTLPHGGVKRSGWGRFNAEWGLEEFVRVKTVTFQE